MVPALAAVSVPPMLLAGPRLQRAGKALEESKAFRQQE